MYLCTAELWIRQLWGGFSFGDAQLVVKRYVPPILIVARYFEETC